MAVSENYGKLGVDEDFSISYWQSQPLEVLFDAAFQLVRDYKFLKEGHADEPRLQRTVEAFRRA